MNPLNDRTRSSREQDSGLATAGPRSSRQRPARLGLVAMTGLVGMLGFLLQHKLRGDDRQPVSIEQTDIEQTTSDSAPGRLPSSTATLRLTPPDWASTQSPANSSDSLADERAPKRLITGIQLVEHTQAASSGNSPGQIPDAQSADPFLSQASPAHQPVEAPRSLFAADPATETEPGRISHPVSEPAFKPTRSPAPSAEASDPFSRPIPLETVLHEEPAAPPAPQQTERALPAPAPMMTVPIPVEISDSFDGSRIQPTAGADAPPRRASPILMDLSADDGSTRPQRREDPAPRSLTTPIELGEREIPAQRPAPQSLPLQEPPRFQDEPHSRSLQHEPARLAPFSEEPPRSAMELTPRAPAEQVSATRIETQAATTNEEVYQVQSGDNYWTISRRFYGTARFFAALAEYNKPRIPRPERMKPGMYVLVPDASLLGTQYPHLLGIDPHAARDVGDQQPGFFVDENGQPCYRVGDGDTLGDIAAKHLGRSSRAVQISGMNRDRIPNPDALKIGTVLRLPADASQVALSPLHAAGR